MLTYLPATRLQSHTQSEKRKQQEAGDLRVVRIPHGDVLNAEHRLDVVLGFRHRCVEFVGDFLVQPEAGDRNEFGVADQLGVHRGPVLAGGQFERVVVEHHQINRPTGVP